MHPGHDLIIQSRSEGGFRAVVAGTGLGVDEVIVALREHDGSVAQTAESLGIGSEQVAAALAYYQENAGHIEAQIKARGSGEG
jgi:hypothetical protein